MTADIARFLCQHPWLSIWICTSMGVVAGFILCACFVAQEGFRPIERGIK